jgi:hypothetical protein
MYTKSHIDRQGEIARVSSNWSDCAETGFQVFSRVQSEYDMLLFLLRSSFQETEIAF